MQIRDIKEELVSLLRIILLFPLPKIILQNVRSLTQPPLFGTISLTKLNKSNPSLLSNHLCEVIFLIRTLSCSWFSFRSSCTFIYLVIHIHLYIYISFFSLFLQWPLGETMTELSKSLVVIPWPAT